MTNHDAGMRRYLKHSMTLYAQQLLTPSHKCHSSYLQTNVKAPGLTSVRSYISAVLHLKQAAMKALIDVTQLHGRADSHQDLKNLDFHRVSMHALLRSEFGALSSRAQEVYVYRHAA